MLGSVNAITKEGQLVASSATGSQLGPFASGAGQLILVLGSQKIVKDLDEALARIRDYVQPYEDQRLRFVTLDIDVAGHQQPRAAQQVAQGTHAEPTPRSGMPPR
jgi:hypothetical protein